MKTGDVKYTPICQTKEQNLIKCDSQLASSFQDMKIKSVKPGHYLQKALLPKSSQSVPMLDEGFKSDEVRFKTWPEKKDKEPDSPVHNSPVPFETIAHSLPIAYSPVTKKIHLIDNSRKENLRCANTEASCFSSTVSSLSDASPSTNGELPHSSDFSESCSTSLISPESNEEVKPKKKGLSGIFSRTVLNWKAKDAENWNFFGKLTNGHIDRSVEDSCRDTGELGSTGLIQLERPSWLPAKSKQEQEHHVNEHEKIISSARKKKIKESKQRKKHLQTQLKAEEEIANSSKIWIQEILPKWSQIKDNKKTQDLWWQGIPPCVRGKLWRLAISNDLNVTHDLYEICVVRSLEKSDDADKESSVESIQLDINRTFPNLCIFQKKGPYYEMLHSLLAAYVCYRPDVGYVQGMSFIAAVLILNMDAPDAFICFSNLLNRPCHRAFYNLDQSLMESYYAAFQDLLKENVPSLFEHLKISKLSPDLYLLDWVYTIYAKAMPLDVASRVWDVFLRDGEQFLFRTAIGVLKLYQDQLMTMDFLRGSQFLTRLPEDLNSDLLFKTISFVKMSIGKRNFQQILFSYTHQDL